MPAGKVGEAVSVSLHVSVRVRVCGLSRSERRRSEGGDPGEAPHFRPGGIRRCFLSKVGDAFVLL